MSWIDKVAYGQHPEINFGWISKQNFAEQGKPTRQGFVPCKEV
jgi:hypothetical protein